MSDTKIPKPKPIRDMSNEEFINHMLLVRDPLTTTALELECFTRLLKQVEEKNPQFRFFKDY